MEKEIAGLIKNSKDLRACLEIEQALPVIKGQILFDFMDAIYHAMEKKGCEFVYDQYECAKDYCNTRNAGQPEFVCEITSFTSRNKTVKLGLGILVNGDLLCYFGYFDEHNNLINNEKFMNGSKRINQCVEDAITQ